MAIKPMVVDNADDARVMSEAQNDNVQLLSKSGTGGLPSHIRSWIEIDYVNGVVGSRRT